MEKFPSWLPYALAVIATMYLAKRFFPAAGASSGGAESLRAGMVWSEVHQAYVTRNQYGRAIEFYA